MIVLWVRSALSAMQLFLRLIVPIHEHGDGDPRPMLVWCLVSSTYVRCLEEMALSWVILACDVTQATDAGVEPVSLGESHTRL